MVCMYMYMYMYMYIIIHKINDIECRLYAYNHNLMELFVDGYLYEGQLETPQLEISEA